MRRALIFLLVALLSAAIGVTASAFSGQSSNDANSFQAAASFCSSPGTQAASADADSWIRQDTPSANFGTDTTLRVRARSGNRNFRALVRFALPSLPSGCSVTLAKLRLYASSAATGRTLEAIQLAAAWTEGGVTWSNQPGTTGAAATTASGLGWTEWAATSQVQAMYSAANNGFLIRDAAENSGNAEQRFHSREMAPTNPPELVITFG